MLHRVYFAIIGSEAPSLRELKATPKTADLDFGRGWSRLLVEMLSQKKFNIGAPDATVVESPPKDKPEGSAHDGNPQES
jgi:hypothetical protein